MDDLQGDPVGPRRRRANTRSPLDRAAQGREVHVQGQRHEPDPRPREDVLERGSVEVFHHDERKIFTLFDLESGHDVRVIELRAEARLGDEEGDGRGILGEHAPEHLQRESLAEAGAPLDPREVDDARRAAAELGDDPIPAEDARRAAGARVVAFGACIDVHAWPLEGRPQRGAGPAWHHRRASDTSARPGRCK